MNIAAVVTAAGSGSRLGRAVPKALVPVADKPMIEWAVAGVAGVAKDIVVTAPADAMEDFRAALSHIDADVTVVAGGENRQESVSLGLAALSGGIEAVLVHDAARPFTPGDVFARVLEGLDSADGVIPMVPVVDTVIRTGGVGVAYLDRSELGAVQTPQAFRPAALLDAHARAARDGVLATDDGALLVHYGYRVDTCAGDPQALKITYQEDLDHFERRLASE